jgi:signal peptidase I
MHYVKRCVALGGDEVMIVNKVLFIRPHEGDVYIKANYPQELITTFEGKMWVKDPYRKDFLAIHNDENVNDTLLYPEQLFNMEPRSVADGEYFMMGDNRDHSQDSRFWGSVPYKYIEGKPWFIYFSWDNNYEIRWERMGRFVDTLERELPVRKDVD